MNEDKKRVDLAQAVKHLQENLPALLEIEDLNAKVAWRKFTALRAEGFDAQQALELCRKL